MNISAIIKKQVVTEKSLAGNVPGRYVFEVDRRAGKGQIREAMKRQFGVEVARVNTLVRKGELRRQAKTRRLRVGSLVKKAVVTLRGGQKIDALEEKEE